MKLYCKHCKKIINRDARTKDFRYFMSKRGYKSYCEEKDTYTYLKPVKL